MVISSISLLFSKGHLRFFNTVILSNFFSNHAFYTYASCFKYQVRKNNQLFISSMSWMNYFIKEEHWYKNFPPPSWDAHNSHYSHLYHNGQTWLHFGVKTWTFQNLGTKKEGLRTYIFLCPDNILAIFYFSTKFEKKLLDSLLKFVYLWEFFRIP